MTGKISLLISDVDGTLVTPSKELTPRTIAAVRGLADRGIAFAVTSGRPPLGMAMLVAPLALTTPLAGFNGGTFANPDMTVREEHTLDPAVARLAVDKLLKLGVDVWVYSAQEWRVRDKAAPHVTQETQTIRLPPVTVTDFSSLPGHIAKIVGVCDDADLLARCEAVLQGVLGGKAAASRSQAYYLDITHPEANKGAVVHAFSRFLSIPLTQIATVGDGGNDVLMFNNSAFSIAMGNARSDVQRQASVTTASNADEGFAKAIEQHLLNKVPACG